MNRFICFVLAAVTAFSLCVSVSAFSPQRIKSLHTDYASLVYDITLDGEAIEASSLTELAAHPASRLEIALAGTDGNVNLFLDQNGAPVNAADVTISKMRAANISVAVNAAYGADLIQDAGLSVQTSTARPILYIDFAPERDSAGIERFDAELDITIGGAEQQNPIRVAGTYGYPETVVTDADTFIVSNGSVLVPASYISGASIDAGFGLTIETPLFAGTRYFVSAAPATDYADTAMLASNREIADILALKTDGFWPGQIEGVRIEAERRLYVLDEAGTLLGTTEDLLPLREKYYLSNQAVLFF